MASPRIEYAVLPAGEGPGQDRCFTADGLVVVLDGASAIDPVSNPDATEYVDTLGPLLIEQITEAPGIDLRDALFEAIRRTAEKLTLVPGTAPSSTVSVARWRYETVDVLVLGDSPVVVQLIDGTEETIVQHPQAHIASHLRRLYRQRLAAGCGYDQTHTSILADIQRHESSLRNVDLGYWISEASPDAARYAVASSWPTEAVSAIVTQTDGAHSHMERLGLGPPAVSTCSRSQLEQLLMSFRDWEVERDPGGKIMPRSKKHDDKSIAVLTSPRGEIR